MNQKEISELRRRFRPEKSGISRVYGCYVNGGREIISELDVSLGIATQEEAEKYLGFLKKALSGALGKNLVDIVFTTQQVMDSNEHRLLSALRDSELQDPEVRQQFYRKVIETLNMEDSNYLILLAHDRYDVPYRSHDDSLQADASDQVFSYIVCCICPVKDAKPQLSYCAKEREFHNRTTGQVVSPPELGFLFPAFDDRAANLYNALYYARNPDELHQELIDGLFHTEAPMSAAQQKEAFQSALGEALGEACSYEVVQAVHEQLRERIQQHKESKDPEPLGVSVDEVSRVLQNCGVAQSQVSEFKLYCDQEFGAGAALSPANLIDSKKFQLSTPEVKVTVDPESSYLVETRIIQGRKYILIPADSGVEVNGVSIDISDPDAEPPSAAN